MEVIKLNDELYHHGVEGQKWGVKHGPPYPLGSNVSTGKRLKNAIGKVTNKKFEISDRTKKILIAAGITAGVIILGTAAARTYKIYGKTHFDTALDKVAFQRYQKGNVFDITDGNSAYMTTGFADKIKYLQLTGGKNDYDTLVKATANNVRVPSLERSRKIFMNVYNNNDNVKRDLGFMFESGLANYSSRRKPTIPDKRRIKLYEKALDIIDTGKTDAKSQSILYDAWNTAITNNTKMGGWSSSNAIFDEFKKNGFSAIWDTHDIYISGFKANNPMIVFDKSGFTNVSSRSLSKAELSIGKNTIASAQIAYDNIVDKISFLLYNPDVVSIRWF